MKKILLFLLSFLPVMANADDSGSCGENLSWSYVESTKTLTVSGSGDMNNYCYDSNLGTINTPWHNYQSLISIAIIEDGVTSIGSLALEDCQNLTSVNLPNSLTSIGNEAFQNCNSLPSIAIPSNVTSIGRDAFRSCISLTSISIPNSVTNIGESAFAGCTSLVTITLPDNITSIKDGTFGSCRSLNTMTVPNNVISIGEYAFSGCISMTTISIPNGVTSIGKEAFSNCTGLIEVTIPNGVKKIEKEVFSGCSNLNRVYIPSSVTGIGNYAFCRCRKLSSISLPGSLLEIGNEAFEGCSSLNSVTIPSSVTNIGNYAFSQCNSLTTVHISDIEAWCKIAFGAYPFTSHHLFLNGNEVKDLVIPSSVTTIGYYSFYNCIGLTSVTIPSSVTNIESAAFYCCSSLKSVTIQNGVKSLKDNAFSYCEALTSITLPSSITEIGGSTFANCTSLTSITIPNNVKSVGELALAYCSSLKTIIIGSGIETIKSNAFANDPELIDFYCYAEKVPSIKDWLGNERTDAFWSSPIENATLHVPEQSINNYKSSEPWKDFKTIVKALPFYTLTYLIDGDVYKTYLIEENTSITAEPAPTKEGYTFSGWSEIPATMPAHDVTVTGSFSINKYKLTYLIDGQEYKTYEVEYGATITPEAEPTKEGYTFSGWSEIPETMPAHDVTVTGTFSINKYKLIYKVDNVEYKSFDIEYGATITPEAEPTKEGYTFSGWSEIPTTMPAHDVTVTGTFTLDTGINQIMSDENGNAMIFTIDGRRVEKLQKNLNIIRMKDGTTHKVMKK